MLFKHPIAKRLLCAVFVSSCLAGGVQIASSQENPGFTIFSGVEQDNILGYRLDFGGSPNGWDRYKMRIPSKKMVSGASKFIIKYPDYFYEDGGRFDIKRVEVRLKDESLPIRDVFWDEEAHIIEIDLEKPILEAQRVEIVLHNVKNPKFGGTYYFHCDVLAANDLPIRLYVGTWIVSIGRSN
ncbi:MAG: DUF2808 domain-containing protein [Chloroflexaceae bacterium]|nr:DUF2808 domain-containing protein [Chloroflexaceae bacterium]